MPWFDDLPNRPWFEDLPGPDEWHRPRPRRGRRPGILRVLFRSTGDAYETFLEMERRLAGLSKALADAKGGTIATADPGTDIAFDTVLE